MAITLVLKGTYKNNKTTRVGVYQKRNLEYIESSKMNAFYDELPNFFTKLKKFKKVQLITISDQGDQTSDLKCNEAVIREALFPIAWDYSSKSFDHCNNVLQKIDDGTLVHREYIDMRFFDFVKKHLEMSPRPFEIIMFKSDPFIDEHTFNLIYNCSNDLKLIVKEVAE